MPVREWSTGGAALQGAAAGDMRVWSATGQNRLRCLPCGMGGQRVQRGPCRRERGQRVDAVMGSRETGAEKDCEHNTTVTMTV